MGIGEAPNIFTHRLRGLLHHGILHTLQILQAISRVPQRKTYKQCTRTPGPLFAMAGTTQHSAGSAAQKLKNRGTQTTLSHFETSGNQR